MSSVKIRMTFSLFLVCFALSAWFTHQAEAAPAGQVIVAKSGGDYTTITAALAAISPSASTPFVVHVMPGTYTENVTMKSFVHLQGAGRELVIVESPSFGSDVISLSGLSATELSGLTVKNGNAGIRVTNSSTTISDSKMIFNVVGIAASGGSSVKISGNLVWSNTTGVSNAISSVGATALVTGNNFFNNSVGVSDSTSHGSIIGNEFIANTSWAIRAVSFGSPTISGNRIIGSGSALGGIQVAQAGPVISENTITGYVAPGITVTASGAGKILHNLIDSFGDDIQVDAGSVPVINFNTYDTVNGTSGVGKYNVKLDGTPAPDP